MVTKLQICIGAGIILLIAILYVLVLYKLEKHKSLSKNEKNQVKTEKNNFEIKNNAATHNYIRPHNFEVGLIRDSICKKTNLCNERILYPPKNVDVDYGNKVSDNCPCTQFIQSP
jgi:predicted membrane protein